MDVAAPNEVEMLKILEATARYFQASQALDDDGADAMMRNLSNSAWFREVWPEIPETRRCDLVDQLILRFNDLCVLA